MLQAVRSLFICQGQPAHPTPKDKVRQGNGYNYRVILNNMIHIHVQMSKHPQVLFLISYWDENGERTGGASVVLGGKEITHLRE